MKKLNWAAVIIMTAIVAMVLMSAVFIVDVADAATINHSDLPDPVILGCIATEPDGTTTFYGVYVPSKPINIIYDIGEPVDRVLLRSFEELTTDARIGWWEDGVGFGPGAYVSEVFTDYQGLHTAVLDTSRGRTSWFEIKYASSDVTQTPIPAPLLLLGSGLVGLVGIRRRGAQ